MDRKEYQKEWMKKYREANKDKVKLAQKKWRDNNKEHNKTYHKEWREDGYYSVYLLPNENYVGQTKQLKFRMSEHKLNGKDISDYRVLHTFETRKEALEKEAEYHRMGYRG